MSKTLAMPRGAARVGFHDRPVAMHDSATLIPCALNRWSLNNPGLLFSERGDLENAHRFYREALERKRRIMGNDHPATLLSMDNLTLS